MNLKLFLLSAALLLITLNLTAQIDVQKAQKVRNRLASGVNLPASIKAIAPLGALRRYDFWTRRRYNNKNYYTLIRIAYNDSLKYLQFSEFPTVGSIRLFQYTYLLNQDLVLDYAYRMESGNDSVFFDEYNPRLNKDNKEIQQLYFPKVEMTINELYDLLIRK